MNYIDVWVKSLVEMSIIDKVSHWGLYIVSSDDDWYDAIVPRWYF